MSISSADKVSLAAFLIVRQKLRLLPVVYRHPGVVLHSTIFLPLQPAFLVVALTNGVSLTGAKRGEEEEEEEDEEDKDFRKEEEEEEEEDGDKEDEEEEDGEDNDFRKEDEDEEEEDGVRLTGAKRGDLEKEDGEEEEDEEEDGEEKEEDLGFTEEPDSERMDLLGVESYEEETRGDLGGYWYPEVVDSNEDEFGPMDDDDLRVLLFGIIL